MRRGFQWFVAWRYLMARPREVSVPIATVWAICALVVAAGAGVMVAARRHLADHVIDLSGRPGYLALEELLVLSAEDVASVAFTLALPAAALMAVAVAVLAKWRSRFAVAVGVPIIVIVLLGAAGILAAWVTEPPVVVLAKLGQQIAIGAGVFLELTLLLGLARYFFTFFTTVSIGGVAIGTMALVIVLSVMNGFETDLRENILGSNAHLRVTRKEGAFETYREVGERIAGIPGVVAHTPYLTSEVVIGANSSHQNVIIKGIAPSSIGNVTDLGEDIEGRTKADRAAGLLRLWPLDEDGTPQVPGDRPGTEEPSPTDPTDPSVEDARDGGGAEIVDPAPDDLIFADEDPISFADDLAGTDTTTGSGLREQPSSSPGLRAGSAGASADGAGAGDRDELVDPAPAGMLFADGEPVDLSGAAEVAPGPPPPDRLPILDFAEDGELFPPAGGNPADLLDLTRPELGLDGGLAARAGNQRPVSARVAALDGVLVGKEAAKNLQLYVGQEVTLVSPLGQITPAGPAPRTKPYRVAGVVFTGMYEYDAKFIYVEMTSFQRFLSLGDEVDGIEIRVEDPDDAREIKAAVEGALGPAYEVRDWQEINRELFTALRLEKIAMFLVLAIIILVASFSIVGNLIMIVVEKAREIAILKTLGSSNQGILKIFVIQGFFIGAVGTGLGVMNGLVACWLGARFGLPLNPDVYYIDRLPIEVEPLAVVAVALAGVVISVLATLYPAYIGGRLRPVDGLRYE